jgi:CRP-like cAMP-binding protein
MTLTRTKHASAMAPSLVGQTQAAESLSVPVCGTASAAYCLANCIATCNGIQDNGQARQNSGGLRLKFFDRAIDARRTIFQSGDRIEGIPVICSGWAAMVLTLPNNRRQIVALLLPGDLVSGGLVFEDKLDVSVEAITNVTYRSYDRSEFRTALFQNQQLFEAILKIWNEQSLHVIRLAASLGQCSAEERVAGLLMKLLERLTPLGMVTDHAFHFPLRQLHIAEITGLTPVHVSRVINLLRREGLIDLSNRSLTVRDPERLRRVCNRKSASITMRAQQSA